MRSPLLVAALLVALPAGAVTIDWLTVGDPGNPPDTATNYPSDTPDCGSVAEAYRISKYESKSAQYAEFLNALAGADPNRLYTTFMSSDDRGGIAQSGSSGSYGYEVKPGRENNPVVFVSFYDALRFANCLHKVAAVRIRPTEPIAP